jgi:hypothetical protein
MRYVNIIIILIIILSLYFWGGDITKFIVNRIGILEQASASLESVSLAGDMKLKVDGVDKGLIRFSQSKFELEGVTEGTHRIELSRISDIQYDPESFVLNFINGYATTIVYEIGPSESVSQGWTLEPNNKNEESDTSLIEVFPNIAASKVRFFYEDTGKEILAIEENKFLLDFRSGYRVLVEKDGYFPISINIFGYKLEKEKIVSKALKMNYILKVYLFELPLKVNYIEKSI